VFAPGKPVPRASRVRNVEVAATDLDGPPCSRGAKTSRHASLVPGRSLPVSSTVSGRRPPLFRPAPDRPLNSRLKAFAKDFPRATTSRPGATQYSTNSIRWATCANSPTAPRKPIVIKADGLAAGKGVVVALTLADAEQALHDMLGARSLGAASARVVIEEFLDGEEASYIAICDGRHALPMATSQDHKRRDDGDLGPNTGGMGAYSPAPVVDAAVEKRILAEVIEPTLSGMAAEGAPFVGFLYAGVMIGRDGAPRVLEFNVRFGDPETQPIMLRLESDLVDLVEAALDGRMEDVAVRWIRNPRSASCWPRTAIRAPSAPAIRSTDSIQRSNRARRYSTRRRRRKTARS
jgi:phosphoribosylamine--glycine ligase